MTAPSADSFELIPWQERLAARMVKLPSFRRLFSERRDDWHLVPHLRARNRTREAAVQELVRLGYDRKTAAKVVADAQDYARTLFIAECDQ